MNSPTDPKEQLIRALGAYNTAAALLRNATSKKLGLNTADTECLSFLSTHGTSTPTQIARYTGLTTGSTTAMLDRLANAKLIIRKPNPNDRRGVFIEVHKNLRKTLRSLYGDVRKTQDKLIDSYTDEQLATIADFLTRFADNAEAYTKRRDT